MKHLIVLAAGLAALSLVGMIGLALVGADGSRDVRGIVTNGLPDQRAQVEAAARYLAEFKDITYRATDGETLWLAFQPRDPDWRTIVTGAAFSIARKTGREIGVNLTKPGELAKAPAATIICSARGRPDWKPVQHDCR